MICRSWLVVILISCSLFAGAQELTLTRYHDDSVKNVSEIFTLKTAGSDTLDGPYQAFYTDGTLKVEGFYHNNRPTGTWRYYFEDGSPKITVLLNDSSSFNQYLMYFENGSVSMSGAMNDAGVRQGNWVFYFENGEKKTTGTYEQGKKVGIWNYFYETGEFRAQEFMDEVPHPYKEFYPDGSLKQSGQREEGIPVGEWQLYYKSGELMSRGSYENGLKNGLWQNFYESGEIRSQGYYLDGERNGKWEYRYENGQISSVGMEKMGVKDGVWKLYYDDGKVKGEGRFQQGSGPYVEYYPDGSVKIEGQLVDGKNSGQWTYYYPSGEIEGICRFEAGEGEYIGYFEDGSVSMTGVINDDKKTGVWKLYKPNGELAGYYRPIYEQQAPQFRLVEEEIQPTIQLPDYVRRTRSQSKYFSPRRNEFRGVIVSTNPFAMVFGSLPFAVEYYLQERLGIETMVNVYRDPFFIEDANVELNKPFKRGYSVSARMKLYSRDNEYGMFYWGHELRYTNWNHFGNVLDVNDPTDRITIRADERRYEYAITIGDRLTWDAGQPGLTVDGYIGLGIGYRQYTEKYAFEPEYVEVFDELNKNELSLSLRLGILIGYMFRTSQK